MNKLIPQEFIDTALTTTNEVKDFIIEDQDDYEYAGSLGKIYHNEIKKIEEYFKPKKAKAQSVHKDWVNAEKEAVDQYKKAKETLKKITLTYEQKLEDLRREEEARLRKDLAARQKEEREAAEEDGLEIEPPEIVPEDIHVAPKIQKQGSTRANWKASVIDKPVFIDWVVKTKHYEYLEPVSSYLNGIAKSVKGPSSIPGVEFFNDPVKIF